MKFTNRQFGEMEFEPKHVLVFPDGIIGFQNLKKYLIVDDADSQPFRWLVSLEDPDISFALIEPDAVLPDYREQHIHDRDTSVFLFVAIKDPIDASTMNLRSPVVIGSTDRMGHQIILEDDTLEMRHLLFANRSELAE